MKLSLYLAKNVFFIILAVLLVIVSIDLVFGVIGQIKSIGINGYTWRNAFLYVLFRLPADVNLILPVAGFLGTLIAFLILSSKSEIIAMRAAGFSMWQLSKAVMITSSVMLILYYALSLFLAPYARHLSYLEENFFGKDHDILVLSSQTWLKADNHFLLMGQVLPDGEINDVTDFVIENGRLSEIRKISSIDLHANETWTLNNISELKLSPTKVEKITLPQLVEHSLISPALLPALAMEPDEMMIHTLAQYIQFRRENKLDVKAYELQFWNRIFAPLMLPIMMLIAIPFGLGSNRAGIQLRLIGSMTVGFAFYIISQFFGSMTLLSPLPAFLGASIPPILFGILAAIIFSLQR